MAIAIDVGVTRRDSLAPVGASLEVDMVNVGASVNDIDINTLATLAGVQILVEGTEAEAVTVGDSARPQGAFFSNSESHLLSS